jgi:hypothetical protein
MAKRHRNAYEWDSTQRYLAIDPATFASTFPAILEKYGRELYDQSGEKIRTIGAVFESVRGHALRPTKLNMTAQFTPLTDGRIGFVLVLPYDLTVDHENGEVTDIDNNPVHFAVQELTREEFNALKVQPVIE